MSRISMITLFATFFVLYSVFAADELVYDRAWINEETWPVFVQDRRIDPNETDGALEKLLKQRYNAAVHEFRDRYIFWLQGSASSPLEQVFASARRMIAARLEIADPPMDRLTLLNEHVEFAKLVEKQAAAISRKFNNTHNTADAAFATYTRADAEIELLRADPAGKLSDALKWSKLVAKSSGQMLEVFSLKRSNPEVVATAFEQLFWNSRDGKKLPQFLADARSRKLLVLGSEEQIKQVRKILAEMGEDD